MASLITPNPITSRRLVINLLSVNIHHHNSSSHPKQGAALCLFNYTTTGSGCYSTIFALDETLWACFMKCILLPLIFYRETNNQTTKTSYTLYIRQWLPKTLWMHAFVKIKFDSADLVYIHTMFMGCRAQMKQFSQCEQVIVDVYCSLQYSSYITTAWK